MRRVWQMGRDVQKAGVLLGFAGVVVALSAANLHGLVAHVSSAVAGLAAVVAGLAVALAIALALGVLASIGWWRRRPDMNEAVSVRTQKPRLSSHPLLQTRS